MRTLSKLLALSQPERRWLAASFVAIGMTCVALRVFTLRRVQGLLEAPPRPGARETGLPLASMARLFEIAANRIPVRVSCLTRSVALAGLLRRCGLDARVRIGVRLEAEEFEAHAWVECDGVTLNDAARMSADYAPLS